MWKRDLKYLLAVTGTQARLAAGLGASEASVSQWTDGQAIPTKPTQAFLARLRVDCQYRIAWLYGHLSTFLPDGEVVVEEWTANAADLTLRDNLAREIHALGHSTPDFSRLVTGLVGLSLDSCWTTSGDYAVMFKPDPDDPDTVLVAVVYPNVRELTTASCKSWLEPFVDKLASAAWT